MKVPLADKTHKILLISFSNIGDAVLSLPVFNSLRSLYPNSKIDIVVGSGAKIVFDGVGGVNRIWINQKGSFRERFKFFFELKSQHYDYVVDLRKSFYSFAGKKWASLFGSAFHEHKRDRHLDILRHSGVGEEVISKSFPDPYYFSENLKFPGLNSTPYVVIAPGAKSDIKRWSEASFAELADLLVSENKFQVIWIGDARDQEIIQKIQGLMLFGPGVNFAGKLSWKESASLIGKASLVVTNDSAPLHMADHKDRKVLALFGPTDPKHYGPQNTSEGYLFRYKFCSPCYQAQCRYAHECLKEITPIEAYKKANDILLGRKKTSEFSILVVRLDRIGDLILSFPAIRAIRDQYPDAKISLLVRPYAQDLALRSPDVDEVIVYDYSKNGKERSLLGYSRFIRELKRRNFKFSFVMHANIRSHLLVFLAGISVRIGYKTRGAWLLTHAIPDERHKGLQHESENVMALTSAFGIPKSVSNVCKLQVFQKDILFAKSFLEKKGLGANEKYILIHPDASAPSKRWPLPYFVEFGKFWKKEFGHRVVVIGQHKKDFEFPTEFMDLRGETSLSDLVGIMKNAELLVTNDSGPSHMAAGIGTRVLSIFGRVEPGLSSERWKPLSLQARTIQEDVGCVQCLHDQCTIGFECLRQLRPEKVFLAARELVIN